MKYFRIIFRLILSIFATAISSVMAFLIGHGGWSGVCRVSLVTWIWCRTLLKIMKIKVTVHGELSDLAGRLIISNHTSYLDILLHGALTRVRFAAKKEIGSYFLIGPMLSSGKLIWIDRKNRVASQRVLTDFRESLAHGLCLLVYPEGTTTDGLHELKPFKSTVFEAICNTDFYVQPIITRTKITANGFNPAWFGDMTLLPHLTKLFEQKCLFSDIYILHPLQALPGEERKAMARRVHEYMNNALKIIDNGNFSEINLLLASKGEK